MSKQIHYEIRRQEGKRGPAQILLEVAKVTTGIKRGEVWWCDFPEPQQAAFPWETVKKRPVLVLGPGDQLRPSQRLLPGRPELASISIIPITTKLRQDDLRFPIRMKDRPCELKLDSIQTVPRSALSERSPASFPEKEFKLLQARLKTFMGLDLAGGRLTGAIHELASDRASLGSHDGRVAVVQRTADHAQAMTYVVPLRALSGSLPASGAILTTAPQPAVADLNMMRPVPVNILGAAVATLHSSDIGRLRAKLVRQLGF